MLTYAHMQATEGNSYIRTHEWHKHTKASTPPWYTYVKHQQAKRCKRKILWAHTSNDRHVLFAVLNVLEALLVGVHFHADEFEGAAAVSLVEGVLAACLSAARNAHPDLLPLQPWGWARNKKNVYVWGWPEPYKYVVYTVILAGKSPIYGHVRCRYRVLANLIYVLQASQKRSHDLYKLRKTMSTNAVTLPNHLELIISMLIDLAVACSLHGFL